MEITDWYLPRLFEGAAAKPYGLIILNQPINRNALAAVIEHAALLVCADAGGDHLMHYDQDPNVTKRLPDAIVGDLDSITSAALQYYTNQGVRKVKDPDQYSTDLTKSLKWMRQEWNRLHGPRAQLDIILMGGLGGRVDQGFSQIHHLYVALQQPDLLHGSIYLLSEQSLSFVLAAGQNKIHVDTTIFAENVGIIPILGSTRISISGFEWDVSDWLTEFGGQLSTSNHIRSDVLEVIVHGTRPLFTLELGEDLRADAPFSSAHPSRPDSRNCQTP